MAENGNQRGIVETTERGGQPPPVYYRSLELEHIRCLKPGQVLNLAGPDGRPAQWTIVLGNNGTGKTTLLQVLASFEAVAVNEVAPPSFAPRIAEAIDISTAVTFVRASDATQIATARLEVAELSTFDVSGSLGMTSEHQWTVSRSPIDKRVSSMRWSDPLTPPLPPPCFGYGAGRRLERSANINPLGLPDNCASLFSDEVSLVNAEEWIRDLDHAASKPSPTQAAARDRLTQLTELLKRILPDVTDIRVTTPASVRPAPRVEFKTLDGWMPLAQLGHAYRGLIAWMVDFTAGMVERYPDSPNPLAEPAVLLVDEIDLHLHPTWQRDLVSHLTKLFPATQFIVTAHSPLVVQGAGASANIAVLRREPDGVVIDNDVDAVRGWRVDQILTSDLFGLPTARPAEFDEPLRRRTQLLSRSALTDSDKAELAALDGQIGTMPTGETAADAERMLRLAEDTARLLKKYGG